MRFAYLDSVMTPPLVRWLVALPFSSKGISDTPLTIPRREPHTIMSRRARVLKLMKLGVKELIKLCIYCWGHPLLYTYSGSVAVWMLLSGNLQHGYA